MIFSRDTVKYFKSIGSMAIQGMAQKKAKTPYFLDDDLVISNYECIRDVWHDKSSITDACNRHSIPRSTYYMLEEEFIKFGVPGLFPIMKQVMQFPKVEELVLLVKNARPSITNIGVVRIAQALPVTKEDVNLDLVSEVLISHGISGNDIPSDRDFFSKLQRIMNSIFYFREKGLGTHRDPKKRNETFYDDNDEYHKRLELLRELHYNPSTKLRKTCTKFGIATSLFYRLAEDYRCYGPWAILPALSFGSNKTLAEATQLEIILKKLRCPTYSGEQIAADLELKCGRHAINRIVCNWGITSKSMKPIDLHRHVGEINVDDQEQKDFIPPKTAIHIIQEDELLRSRRQNRHFEIICDKMRRHSYNICDPGPILLAPFVNDLGIIQAFETYGPLRLRGKDMSNLALLNIMRILAGYRQINHLSNNRDRSVALASGIGIFGSHSKFYENTIEFKFDHLNNLRCDLVARAKELAIIEGKKIAFDFHFKEFYGSHAEENGIGHGPDKSGRLVPGFRPHVVWDLAENVIINMAYYQGAARSPSIIREFCEQNVFPVLDKKAIEEIYMDSEYTKESDLQYFKVHECKNSDVYICLKQNKQIQKLIAPALLEMKGWEEHEKNDERKMISVVLPKTGLPLKIVILRDRLEKDHIRCFGTTKETIEDMELLNKYRYRWNIENGLKDLVYSYFADEMFGHDPEKIEFEFYCIMTARLAYEHFLKTLGGQYLKKDDGTKFTLGRMRHLLFEKQNCTISQDTNNNLVLTFLDCQDEELKQGLTQVYTKLSDKGKNKVIWWDNRGLVIEFKKQQWN
jgi:hypothetical protein